MTELRCATPVGSTWTSEILLCGEPTDWSDLNGRPTCIDHRVADWARWLGRRAGGITIADGARFIGPDTGTWVAEAPHIDAYWDLAEGQRPGGKPGVHLPWVDVHKRGGKGVGVVSVPGQMLGRSLGLEA